MRVVGIDPGSSCGMVALDLPFWPDHLKASWAGSALVRHPAASRERPTAVLRDLHFVDLLARPLEEWRPGLIVLEEACDAGRMWRSSSAGMRRMKAEGDERDLRRSTLFRSGAHYALALLASSRCRRLYQTEIVSHPVTNHQGRRGWMQSSSAQIPTRDHILANTRLFARAITGAEEIVLSEHECMALALIRAQMSFATVEKMLARSGVG